MLSTEGWEGQVCCHRIILLGTGLGRSRAAGLNQGQGSISVCWTHALSPGSVFALLYRKSHLPVGKGTEATLLIWMTLWCGCCRVTLAEITVLPLLAKELLSPGRWVIFVSNSSLSKKKWWTWFVNNNFWETVLTLWIFNSLLNPCGQHKVMVHSSCSVKRKKPAMLAARLCWWQELTDAICKAQGKESIASSWLCLQVFSRPLHEKMLHSLVPVSKSLVHRLLLCYCLKDRSGAHCVLLCTWQSKGIAILHSFKERSEERSKLF